MPHILSSALRALALGVALTLAGCTSAPAATEAPCATLTCDGRCVDPQNDRANCGACGKACADGELCVAGACAVSCPAGQSVCDGACVSPKTDRANCGACGKTCADGEACVDGACAVTCPTGQSVCGGACVGLKTDLANCGACGKACAAGEVCSDGACARSCGADESTCTASTTGQRYCANVATDNANCGACGVACGAGTWCVAGSCKPACKPGAPSADDATCDGLDDDCDGTADEDYAPKTTSCGVGACGATGHTSCVAGHEIDDCKPLAKGASDTTCDGVDDDCNGKVDDGYAPVATSCGVGECASKGQLQCVGGAVVDSCAPSAYCAWKTALPTEPYAALAAMSAADPCTLATFDRQKCDYYLAAVDDLIEHNTQPPGCRTAAWKTDPSGLGAAQQALAPTDRHLFFVDACNPSCTDGPASEATAAWDGAAQATRRARATNPATPACSIAGVSSVAIRSDDRVLFRRGLVQHFAVDTAADSYVWAQLMLGTYGVSGAQLTTNYSLEAYPGDAGLVTLQFARTSVGRTSTGRYLMVERDKADPEYAQLFNGVGNPYALYVYGIKNLSVTGLRFAGTYNHDGSNPKVPAWVPKGRYHGLAAQLSANDVTLRDSEFLWSEGFERAIPHMACTSGAGTGACAPIVLDNGVSIAKCDPTSPTRFSSPCAAGADLATNTLRLLVPGQVALRHTKVVGARKLPKRTSQTYYDSRGDIAGVTQDAAGFEPPPSRLDVSDAYLADAGHFLISVTRNGWAHDSVFRNRLHSSIAIAGDAVIEDNLFLDGAQAAPDNFAAVIQGVADGTTIQRNKMYVSGPGIGGLGLTSCVGAAIKRNVYYDESGIGGWWAGCNVLAGTSAVNLQVSDNLVFGVNGYKGPDVSGVFNLFDWSGDASYSAPPLPAYASYARMVDKGVTLSGNRAILTATESKLVGAKVFRASDGATLMTESIRYHTSSAGAPASVPGLSFERLDLASVAELRSLFWDGRVDADWTLLETRALVPYSLTHIDPANERY